MKCPSCQAVLSKPVPRCPNCGLTLTALDAKFGAVPRHSPFLTDHTGSLSGKEISQLTEVLRLFTRKFPQSRFSVFLTNQMPPKENIAEYAFWLMNRGRFGFVEAVAEENFDLLLVIEVQRRAAVLIVGYGLEDYLTERDLEEAVASAVSFFHAGNFTRGIQACIDVTTHRMRELVLQTEAAEAAARAAAAEQPKTE